jgi:hypothetical protein
VAAKHGTASEKMQIKEITKEENLLKTFFGIVNHLLSRHKYSNEEEGDLGTLSPKFIFLKRESRLLP